MSINDSVGSHSVATAQALPLSPLGESNIDVMQYVRAVLNFKWRIVALSIVITLLAAMWAMSLTPIFRATATLLIESEQANTVSVEEIYGRNTGNREYFQTQLAILRSRRIAELVLDAVDFSRYDLPAKKQGLPSLKEIPSIVRDWMSFSPKPTEPSSPGAENFKVRQARITLIANSIGIIPMHGTHLVRVRFDSHSPELSALVANTIPVVYINNQLEAKMSMTQKVTSWLSERQFAMRDALSASEQKLYQYTEAHDLVDVQGIEGLASQELNQLTAQLSDARRRLAQSESIYKVVQNRSGRSLESLPEVLNHAVIQTAKRSEEAAARNVSELARRYGPKHPKMINAREELIAVQENVRGQILTLVTGIENEYNLSRSDVENLEAELATARQGFQQVSRKGSEFRELQREVEINRGLYDAFLKRFTETSETNNFTQANARVTDEALVPFYQIKPSKKKIVLAAFMMSLMLGVGLALLYEFLHDGIRSVSDVENKLSMRLLGLLPLIPCEKDKRLDTYVYFQNKERAFQEAVRSLRTSVVLSHIETSAKIITVTSTLANEGKSTVASNLAFALGQTEKVLLIDGDLRKPSLGKMFELAPYHAGLSNLIANTNTLAECLVSDDLSGIDFMPAGTIPPNPQELLISPRFENALKVLSDKYDRIIIDSAPVQLVSDSLLLSRYSDSMLYVVRSDNTSINAVKRGLGHLFQVNARIDGVILNLVDLESTTGYGEYYYGGYGEIPDVESAQGQS